MRKTFVVTASLMVLLAAFVAPPAAAQVGYFGTRASDVTYVTFSRSVEVPGAVLPAGTYVFKRLTPRVIQVFNKNESTIYTTFMTIPTWRAKAASKDEMVFGEAASCCAPAPVKVWYPAYRWLGDEFVYPNA
jgi:hypothetical protein